MALINRYESLGRCNSHRCVHIIETRRKDQCKCAYFNPFRFLFGLSIRHVGQETSKDIAAHFGTFQQLWKYLLDEVEKEEGREKERESMTQEEAKEKEEKEEKEKENAEATGPKRSLVYLQISSSHLTLPHRISSYLLLSRHILPHLMHLPYHIRGRVHLMYVHLHS